MRFLPAILLFAVSLTMVGCESLSSKQYVVRNAALTEKAAVSKIVAASSKDQGFVFRPADPNVPQAIARFERDWYASVEVWTVDEDVVVQLSAIHPGRRASVPGFYSEIDRRLAKHLSEAFAGRLVVDSKPPRPKIKAKEPNQSSTAQRP